MVEGARIVTDTFIRRDWFRPMSQADDLLRLEIPVRVLPAAITSLEEWLRQLKEASNFLKGLDT
jgi:hypothetical protein